MGNWLECLRSCHISTIGATQLPCAAYEHMLSVLINTNSLSLSCLMHLTFSNMLNVQTIVNCAACEFFFFLFSCKKVNVLKHTKAPVNSTAAESYIIFWVYGFLISRYSSQDDVTDMDSEHISNIFLEDIQYGCQETFDQIIKIDNPIYLESHWNIKSTTGGNYRWDDIYWWPF